MLSKISEDFRKIIAMGDYIYLYFDDNGTLNTSIRQFFLNKNSLEL